MTNKNKTIGPDRPMQALPLEMWEFISKRAYYKSFHHSISDPQSLSVAKDFLDATLDEVRLYRADQYANLVLGIPDIADARHFRQGVLRREASGDVEYNKQRDHAAHTLHNYLLGWYFYESSQVFQNAIWAAMDKRLPSRDEDHITCQMLRFGSIWPYVSLLHDVGYLFEGGLANLQADIYSERVKRGAQIADEYFRNRFWVETRFSATKDRELIQTLTGIKRPDFYPFTVTAVGDSLRSMGNLGALWSCVREDLRAAKLETKKIASLDIAGNGDAFNLWRQHYSVYSPSMEKRITQLQDAFYSLIWDGLPNVGIRVLDHGISGGLLLLQYATYYYQMHFGIVRKTRDEGSAHDALELEKRLVNRVTGTGRNYYAYWWWTSVVWATAAVALHNLQQQGKHWPGCREDIDPLTIDEDPLAYLGILVDVLQEWDRYTVMRSSIFTGKLPLQGKDVQIGVEGGLVHIDYGDADRSKKVRSDLDKSLKDWSKMVRISP